MLDLAEPREVLADLLLCRVLRQPPNVHGVVGGGDHLGFDLLAREQLPPPPSEEDIRSFVFDSLFDNRWDNDLRVRRISLTADAPSFKVKVPRTSRAGVNETLTGEQVAARLVSVMRSRAHRGKTMDEWRKEQLAWLLDPVRPAKKG